MESLNSNTNLNKPDSMFIGGIPPLIKLLDHGNPTVEQNACGALRNLSYGNDKNKIEMKNHEGVPAVVRLIRSTKVIDTKEQATGNLNLRFTVFFLVIVGLSISPIIIRIYN